MKSPYRPDPSIIQREPNCKQENLTKAILLHYHSKFWKEYDKVFFDRLVGDRSQNSIDISIRSDQDSPNQQQPFQVEISHIKSKSANKSDPYGEFPGVERVEPQPISESGFKRIEKQVESAKNVDKDFGEKLKKMNEDGMKKKSPANVYQISREKEELPAQKEVLAQKEENSSSGKSEDYPVVEEESQQDYYSIRGNVNNSSRGESEGKESFLSEG